MEVKDKVYMGVKVNGGKVNLEFDEEWYNDLDENIQKDIVFWMDTAIRIAKHRKNNPNGYPNEATNAIMKAVLQMFENVKNLTPEDMHSTMDFTFTYKDLMDVLDWNYEKVKKYTILLLNKRVIVLAEGSSGGRGHSKKYKLA